MRQIRNMLNPQAVRAGKISGRTVLVLAASLTLALLAMVLLLAYFYSMHSPQVAAP